MLENIYVNLPFIDRIWRVKGSLPLETPTSSASAFAKLDPLFQATETSFAIDGDTLTYDNKNPAAQDKLATFARGTLRVVEDEGGAKLLYDLVSPALLFCFLAPLLFLGFAQLTILVGTLDKPTAAEEAKAEAKSKKAEAALAAVPMNPIDKALGAPAPDKPKKDEKKDKGKDKEEDKNKGPSPTPAYVFAGIFAALFVVGRILEPWLIRREFRRRLSGARAPDRESASAV
jgi:hypothetical protein